MTKDPAQRRTTRAEREEMERRLREVRGIAHDLTNSLAATTMHLGLLRRGLPSEPEMSHLLREMEDEMSRAADLVRRLLILGRGEASRSVLAKTEASSPSITAVGAAPTVLLVENDLPLRRTSATCKTRILIVDDHPLMRSGLRLALEQHPGFVLVGEASTAAAAVNRALELQPDLVVMDLHLPDMSGLDATRKILTGIPSAKVVIFSADTDRRRVDAALEAGACGYILKKSVVDELIQAIQLVTAGKLYLSPEVSAGILEDYRKSLTGESEPSKPVVSAKDKRLLRLICEGRRSKEIAVEMGLSPNSIETYRGRLMKRLRCFSTAELVRFAIREGLAKA